MTTQTQTTLGQKAVTWWCPAERNTAELVEAVGSTLFEAQVALGEKDFGRFHMLLNAVAASELGYDTVAQEEELLEYLDDLVRGYH